MRKFFVAFLIKLYITHICVDKKVSRKRRLVLEVTCHLLNGNEK